MEKCLICGKQVDLDNYIGYLCEDCYYKYESEIVSYDSRYDSWVFDPQKMDILLEKLKGGENKDKAKSNKLTP